MHKSSRYEFFKDLLEETRSQRPFGRPRFDFLLRVESRFRELKDLSAGMSVTSSLAALKEQRFCSCCQKKLASCSVCNLCRNTPEGARIRALEMHRKASRTKISKFPEEKARTLELRRKTFQKNWDGVDNPMKHDAIKGLIKERNVVRYIDGHPSRDPLVKAKKIQTWMNKYGVDNPGKNRDSIRKGIDTCQDKYGASRFMFTPEGKAAADSTQRARYTGGHSARDPVCNDKRRQTNLLRRGVAFPMQSPEVFRKAQSRLYSKKMVCILDKDLRVAGYEGLVLSALEKRLIKVEVRPGKMPPIWWKDTEDKEHRYFPDALVQTTDGRKLLLEVKSNYTIRGLGVVRKAKAAWKFCRDLPTLEYWVVLYDKRKLTWISSVKELLRVQAAQQAAI